MALHPVVAPKYDVGVPSQQVVTPKYRVGIGPKAPPDQTSRRQLRGRRRWRHKRRTVLGFVRAGV